MPSSCRHDAFLEPSWSHLRSILAELGPNLGPKRAVLQLGRRNARSRLALLRWPNLQNYALRGLTLRASLRSYLPQACRRIQPAERGPGGGLTATYCTQLGRMRDACAMCADRESERAHAHVDVHEDIGICVHMCLSVRRCKYVCTCVRALVFACGLRCRCLRKQRPSIDKILESDVDLRP